MMVSIEIIDPGEDPAAVGPAPAGTRPVVAAVVAVVGLALLGTALFAMLVRGGPGEVGHQGIPPSGESIADVDLRRLDGPMALTSQASGAEELWVLDDGAASWLGGVRPWPDGVIRPARLHWWGEQIVYLSDGRLWQVPAELDEAPRPLAPASFTLPSSSPEHLWVVVNDAAARTRIVRYDADSGEAVDHDRDGGYGNAIGLGPQLITRIRDGEWALMTPGTRGETIAGGTGLFPLAARGDVVFFGDPFGSPLVLTVTDVGRVEGGTGRNGVIRHDFASRFGDTVAIDSVCPSPDGSRFAAQFDNGLVAMVATQQAGPIVFEVLAADRRQPMAWVGPDQFVYVPPRAGGSPGELTVLDVSSGVPEVWVVADLVGRGPWKAATPNGSCR